MSYQNRGRGQETSQGRYFGSQRGGNRNRRGTGGRRMSRGRVRGRGGSVRGRGGSVRGTNPSNDRTDERRSGVNSRVKSVNSGRGRGGRGGEKNGVKKRNTKSKENQRNEKFDPMDLYPKVEYQPTEENGIKYCNIEMMNKYRSMFNGDGVSLDEIRWRIYRNRHPPNLTEGKSISDDKEPSETCTLSGFYTESKNQDSNHRSRKLESPKFEESESKKPVFMPVSVFEGNQSGVSENRNDYDHSMNKVTTQKNTTSKRKKGLMNFVPTSIIYNPENQTTDVDRRKSPRKEIGINKNDKNLKVPHLGNKEKTSDSTWREKGMRYLKKFGGVVSKGVSYLTSPSSISDTLRQLEQDREEKRRRKQEEIRKKQEEKRKREEEKRRRKEEEKRRKREEKRKEKERAREEMTKEYRKKDKGLFDKRSDSLHTSRSMPGHVKVFTNFCMDMSDPKKTSKLLIFDKFIADHNSRVTAKGSITFIKNDLEIKGGSKVELGTLVGGKNMEGVAEWFGKEDLEKEKLLKEKKTDKEEKPEGGNSTEKKKIFGQGIDKGSKTVGGNGLLQARDVFLNGIKMECERIVLGKDWEDGCGPVCGPGQPVVEIIDSTLLAKDIVVKGLKKLFENKDRLLKIDADFISFECLTGFNCATDLVCQRRMFKGVGGRVKFNVHFNENFTLDEKFWRLSSSVTVKAPKIVFLKSIDELDTFFRFEAEKGIVVGENEKKVKIISRNSQFFCKRYFFISKDSIVKQLEGKELLIEPLDPKTKLKKVNVKHLGKGIKGDRFYDSYEEWEREEEKIRTESESEKEKIRVEREELERQKREFKEEKTRAKKEQWERMKRERRAEKEERERKKEERIRVERNQWERERKKEEKKESDERALLQSTNVSEDEKSKEDEKKIVSAKNSRIFENKMIRRETKKKLAQNKKKKKEDLEKKRRIITEERRRRRKELAKKKALEKRVKCRRKRMMKGETMKKLAQGKKKEEDERKLKRKKIEEERKRRQEFAKKKSLKRKRESQRKRRMMNCETRKKLAEGKKKEEDERKLKRKKIEIEKKRREKVMELRKKEAAESRGRIGEFEKIDDGDLLYPDLIMVKLEVEIENEEEKKEEEKSTISPENEAKKPENEEEEKEKKKK